MSYNVLNNDWDKITVDVIDINIHKHLSGREFTEDDACVKQPVTNYNDEFEEKVNREEKAIYAEIKEMDKEQAIEAYKEKYGRKPHPKAKLETIIAKL